MLGLIISFISAKEASGGKFGSLGVASSLLLRRRSTGYVQLPPCAANLPPPKSQMSWNVFKLRALSGKNLLVKKLGVLLLTALVVVGCKKKSETTSDLPVVHVYTYSSFMGVYGPGPKLKETFEQRCKCRVQFVKSGDSALLLQKAQLLTKSPVDLIIGLDQFYLNKALSVMKWRKIPAEGVEWIEQVNGFVDSNILPYDWSPLTLVYRKGAVPVPKNFLDVLKDPKYKKSISLQDPRTSTPGQQFLFWTTQGSENFEETWRSLRQQVHSVSPSWSTSYGLFQKGQVNVTFSYLTSPVYHWIEEGEESVQPMVFKEGHPYQVEFLGVPDRCQNCELALNFAQYLLSSEAQKIIAEMNYMLPVVKDVPLREEFLKLPKVELLKRAEMDVFVKTKDESIKKWLKIFRK